MIEIKPLFGDWQEVPIEKAREYIVLIERMMLSKKEERIKYIEENRLRGISYKELMVRIRQWLKTN